MSSQKSNPKGVRSHLETVIHELLKANDKDFEQVLILYDHVDCLIRPYLSYHIGRIKKREQTIRHLLGE